MNHNEEIYVESRTMNDFEKAMKEKLTSQCQKFMGLDDKESKQSGRIDLNGDNVKNGLGQLVLTIMKLLHELLEREAIRHVDAGYLSDAEIERLGVTLMRQAQEIERLRKEFNLEEEDLNLDLGPLGKLF